MPDDAYHEKHIFFNPHAIERFAQYNIPTDEIRKMLKSGVIVDDLGHDRRKLCIYKRSQEYLTIVFEPIKEYVFIITSYPSKEWEIDMFKKGKR